MESQKHEDHKRDPPAGCFFRMYWMIIGNALLVFSAFFIAQESYSFFSLVDVLYWAFVGCLLAARYVDIRYLKGLTADGGPASMAHWRRYAVLLGIVSVGLWLVTHGIAHFGAEAAE